MATLSLKTHSSAVRMPHPLTHDELKEAATTRVSTGVAELDRLLAGGLPAGRSVLVCGPAGSAKTTLALQFLMAGVAGRERAVLALVDEKPRHLIQDARAFGWDLAGASDRKLLLLLDASPYFLTMWRPGRELDAREVASDLTRQVRSFGGRRLVIDPITSLGPQDESPQRIREFFRALVFSLEDNLDCTVLFTAPLSTPPAPALAVMEELASGVVELRMDARSGKLARTLTVRKMRATPVEPFERLFGVQPDRGVVLVDSHE